MGSKKTKAPASKKVAQNPISVNRIFSEMTQGVRSLQPKTLDALYCNAAAAALYGYSVGEIENNPQLYLESIAPRDHDRVRQFFQEVLNTGEGEITYQVQTPQGQIQTIQEKCWLNCDRHNQPLSLDSILTPVTAEPTPILTTEIDRFNLEREAIRFRKLVTNIPGVVYQYVIDSDGNQKFTYISPGIKDIYGVTAIEAEKEPQAIWSKVHPEDLENLQNSVTQSMTTLERWETQWRIITPSGQLKWLSGIAQPERKANGDTVWDGFLFDITDRRQAAIQFQETETLYRTLLSKIPNGIVAVYDRDLRYTLIEGEQELNALGLASSQLLGKTPQECLPLEAANIVTVANRKVFAGENVNTEIEFGGYNYIISGTPLKNEQGEIIACLSLCQNITSLKQTEQALRQSEERLKFAIMTAEMGIWDWYLQTGEMYISPEWRDRLGYTEEDIQNNITSWSQTLYPPDAHKINEALERHLTDPSCPYACDHRLVTKSGEIRWVFTEGKIVQRDENGQPLRIVGITKDITDRKKAEEERDRFFNVSLELFCIIGFDGYFKRINPVWEETLGYTQAELLGIPFIELVHPDDVEKTISEAQEIAQGKKTQWFENRYRCQNGFYKWLAWTMVPFLEDGVMYAVARDVSTRKAAELELENTQKFLASILDNIPVAIIAKEAKELHIVLWNRAAHNLFGLAPEEVLGKSDIDLFPPEQAAFFNGIDRQVLSTGKLYDIPEEEARTAQGKVILHTQKVPIFDPEGQPLYLLAITEDITARKQAERTLREQEQFLRSIYEGLDQGIFVVDITPEGDYRYGGWNALTETITGISSEEGYGKGPEDIFSPEEALIARQRYQQCITSKAPHSSEDLLRFRNQEIWVLTTLNPIMDESGSVYRLVGTATNITDRKQTEISIREREQFLNTIFEGIDQAIFVVDVTPDHNFRYVSWNSVALNAFDLRIDEVIGQTPEEIFGQETGYLFSQHYRRCLQQGRTFQYEEVGRGYGKLQWWLTTLNPLKNEAGEIYRIIGTANDITARKKAEITLREREEFLGSIYDGVEQAIFAIDVGPDGNFYYGGWNKVSESFAGIKSSNIQGKTPEEVFGEKKGVSFRQHYQNCLEAGTSIRYEESFDRQGQEFYTLTTLTPLISSSGRIYRIIGTAVDITERKEAQLALERQAQFLGSIYDGVEQVIIAVNVTEDRDFRYESWNALGLSILNLSLEQIKGKTPEEIMGATWGAFYRKLFNDCLEAQKPIQIEYSFGESQGQENWWLTTMNPLRNHQGRIYQIIATSNNITERKKAEISLQNQARQEELINRLANQIRISLDVDQVLETAVQEIRNLLQCDRSYFVWHHFEDGVDYWDSVKESKVPELPSLLGRYSFEQLGPMATIFLQGQTLRIDRTQDLEEPILRELLFSIGYTAVLAVAVPAQSGRMGMWCVAHCHGDRPWTDEEVELIESAANQLSIAINQAELYEQTRTKTKELEQAYRELQQTQSQLIQSEKMSSLGQLVAGVAHEINNPVNFIYGNLTHATDYISDLLELIEIYQTCYPNPVVEVAEEIEAIDLEFILDDLPRLLDSMKLGSERIKEIVKSLRTFSRLDEAEMKAVDLHENIDSTLMILQHRLKAKAEHPEIKVIKNYGQLPLVACFVGQLNQVFMNLLSNAIDAVEDKTKGLSYQEIEAAPGIITITTKQIDEGIQVRIVDNGIGINPEKVQRVFDPFYTTKPIGKGTGLGLSISYQIIVEKHRGRLICESELGQGTAFIIEIPQDQPEEI